VTAAVWPAPQLLALRDTPLMRAAILEFQPTATLVEGMSAAHGALIALTVVAAAVLGLFRPPSADRVRNAVAAVCAVPWLLAPPDGMVQWPYRVTAALVAAASFEVVPALRRRAWFLPFLFAGFTILAVPILRNLALVPAFAVLLVLPAWDPREGAVARGSVGRRGLAVVAVGLVVVAAGARLLDRLPPGQYRAPERTGWGIDDTLVPRGAVDAWLANPVDGPMFNTFDHGGYLLYRLHPGRGVFIAGNTSMYPPGFLAEYRERWIGADDPGEALRRSPFTSAILGLTAPEATPVVRALAGDPRWILRHVDDGGALFVRAGPGVESVGGANSVLEAAVGRWTSAPEGARDRSVYPALNRVLFLRDMGRPVDALRVWRHVAGGRDDAHAVAVGAQVAEAAGLLEGFVPDLEAALDRTRTDPAVLQVAARRAPAEPGPALALAAALARAGRDDEARGALGEALDRAPDAAVRQAAEADPWLQGLLP
jgi:hypothetical protein